MTQELWYYRRGQDCKGPFPSAQIAQYVELGRLGARDLISLDGVNWVTVAESGRFDAALADFAMTHAPSPPEPGVDWERERALARQRWADERAGAPSRDRPEARAGEPVSLYALRQDHQQTQVQSLQAARRRLPYRYGLAALSVLLAVSAAVWIGQRQQSGPAAPRLTPRTDCSAPPAPEVAWQGCDKRWAGLAAARLRGARLAKVRLDGADLRGADLRYADLQGASLRGANLLEAFLTGADLTGADLSGADLSRADLQYALLSGARTTGARLAGTRLGRAVWPDGRVCAPQSVDVCQ